MQASTLELRFQIAHRVGELGEHQYLLIGKRLRQEVPERVQLGVVGRTPLAVSFQQLQQRVGIRLQVGFQRGIEEIGPKPSEAAPVTALVVLVYSRGARGRVGCRPVVRIHGAVLFGFRFIPVVIVGGEVTNLGCVRVCVGESGVQHLGILSAQRERQTIPQGVEEHIVSEQVPLHRLQESRAAAFKALEQVGPAEAHKPFACPGKILDLPLLSRKGRCCGRIGDIVAETVTGQAQRVHGIDHVRRVQLGILVVRVGVVNGELDRLGHPVREKSPSPVLIGEEPATRGRVRLRVIVLDEASGPAYQVQTHQIAPVVGILAPLKGGQGAGRSLVASAELDLPQFAQESLRSYAKVLVVLHEDSQLTGQVQVGLVVGRCGKQDALAVVSADVLPNRAIPPALAVTQVVALVDDDQSVSAEIGQFAQYPAEREDPGPANRYSCA